VGPSIVLASIWVEVPPPPQLWADLLLKPPHP